MCRCDMLMLDARTIPTIDGAHKMNIEIPGHFVSLTSRYLSCGRATRRRLLRRLCHKNCDQLPVPPTHDRQCLCQCLRLKNCDQLPLPLARASEICTGANCQASDSRRPLEPSATVLVPLHVLTPGGGSYFIPADFAADHSFVASRR